MSSAATDNSFALILLTDVETASADFLPIDSSIRSIARVSRKGLAEVFAAAAAKSCSHVIMLRDEPTTRDADVGALIAASKLHSMAMVLGSRPAPVRPTLRERFAALILRLETGKRLAHGDGPRVYPMELIEVIGLDQRSDMGEVEAVVRTVWSGCRIVDIALGPSLLRSRDASSPNGFALHARLLARSLTGWPHKKFGPRRPRRHRHTVLKELWQWCNPIHAWRELRQGGASRNEMAIGIAVGVFIANTPTYGVQMLLALHVARRLHLHPAAVVAGSKASTPPIGPMLIAGAVWLGHIILHGSALKWSNMRFHGRNPFAAVGPLALDWCIGALIIGTTTAVIAYVVASFLFRFVERREKQHGDTPSSAVQS
jgi:hypothetical protein